MKASVSQPTYAQLNLTPIYTDQLPKYDQNDKLLKGFHTYHENALSYVSSALDQLKVISNDLDELKKHTRRPRIAGNKLYASSEVIGSFPRSL